MSDVANVVVIGGGPAGAMTAATLAAAGHEVLLIDEKLAWEKPCGGGITRKALIEFPFLAEAKVERNWIRGCELTSPAGKRAYFEVDQRVAIFSREVLNGLLLERAERAGAKIKRGRVISIDGAAGRWVVRTSREEHHASYVVLAAGARTQLRRQFAGSLSPADLMITAGYYIPGTADDIQIRFLPGVEGYIWVFPRSNHFSVGICGKMDTHSGAQLRSLLVTFIHECGLNLEGAVFYGHVLPALRKSTLEHEEFQGDGWAMVGDTAGFVDPITGEGLYYALRSGELLAQALIASRPEQYTQAVQQDMLPELITAAQVSKRFYSGNFLGSPVTDRMVQLTARSEHFRELMRDIFSGTQGYRGMRRRAYRAFALALPEMLFGKGRIPKQTEADLVTRPR